MARNLYIKFLDLYKIRFSSKTVCYTQTNDSEGGKIILKQLITFFVLCLCIIAPTTTNASSFKDVKDDAYYYDAVHALYERGVVSGKGDGKFAPNDYVTRGQAAKMIAKALQIEALEDGAAFRDVPATNSFYPYIAALTEFGILSGYTDGTFRPNDYMTRQQMAKVIARAYVLHSKETEQHTALPFQDVQPSSSVYADVQALHYYGIASSQEKFNGGDRVKRGQMTAFIVRAEAIELTSTANVVIFTDGYVTMTNGIFKFDGQDVPVTIRTHGDEVAYTFTYKNRMLTAFEPVLQDEELVEQPAQLHASDIGLFEIISVKAKDEASTIEVNQTAENLSFTANGVLNGSEWFTIVGQSYLYDHIVEIDVELFAQNGKLQYDFHFKPSTYTLEAKDFTSEVITNVQVLNETPIDMTFKNGVITLTSSTVSAKPIQLKVTTEQNGKQQLFTRSIIALADGRLMEDLYAPLEGFGIQQAQQVIDVEGHDATEHADYLYVHADFEGAKIPVIHDIHELQKYGRYSDAGQFDTEGQYVITLLRDEKVLLYGQVKDSRYSVDEVAIPEEFAKVYAVEKEYPYQKHDGSYFVGKNDTHLQFARNFFDEMYNIGHASFYVMGQGHNDELLKKKYKLTFYGSTVTFEEVETSAVTVADQMQAAIEEQDANALAVLLRGGDFYSYSSLQQWSMMDDAQALTFSEYIINKYSKAPMIATVNEMLDFESQIGLAKTIGARLFENPYSMYDNWVYAQLQARISLTDELFTVLTDAAKLQQKVAEKPFVVTGGSADVLEIGASLTDWYENRAITIEQNGKTYKAQAYVDYPYGLYFNVENGELTSGNMTIKTTSNTGKSIVMQQDVALRPTLQNYTFTRNNEVTFTYSNTVELTDEVVISVYANDEFTEITPVNTLVEGGRNVVVTVESAQYKLLQQAERAELFGLQHRYKEQLIDVYQ